MILVPLLTRWAKLPDKKAFATSISIIAPMCLVSIVIYYFQGSLSLSDSLPYLVGGLLGGLLGGKLFGIIGIVFFIPLAAVISQLLHGDIEHRLAVR